LNLDFNWIALGIGIDPFLLRGLRHDSLLALAAAA
jgi:hypothetical protein